MFSKNVVFILVATVLFFALILWQSATSDPQKLNATSELNVRLTYGPLDYSFSDDYYIFRAFVYPDDLDGNYISEDYGANVVPEFISSLMILSIAAMFGHIIGRRGQKTHIPCPNA